VGEERILRSHRPTGADMTDEILHDHTGDGIDRRGFTGDPTCAAK
jgi:hypothetical protein